MDFGYTKIRVGNWLYRHCFPLYDLSYSRFKRRNDKDEIALTRRLVRPGDHVLDIGANIGFYAELLSELTGTEGRVYSFEPDARNFRRLRDRVGDRANVELFQAAVSERNGTLKIYRSKLLNVDHRTYPVDNYESVDDVAAWSIDSLVAARTVQRVDVVKIDVQGYELSAFRGMQQLLERASPTILAEFWPHGFRRAGTSASELFDFFSALDYAFFEIRGADLVPISRDFVEAHDDEPFEFGLNVLIARNGDQPDARANDTTRSISTKPTDA